MNSDHNNTHNLPDRPEQYPATYAGQQALKPYEYRDRHDDTQDDDDEIDLRELWHVVMRRKWLILSIAFLVFVTTLLFTLMQTPIYRASTTLQIKPENAKLVNYDVDLQAQNINSKDFYQTQYELLKSHALANRVIDDLRLEPTLRGEELAKPFFAETMDSFKESLTGLLPSQAEDEEITEEVVVGKRPISSKFLANLSISPVKNSQIVTVHYDDPNPERAAIIANAVASEFTEMNLDRRRDAAVYAEQFLSEEIEQAQSQLFELENELNQYATDRGIIETGEVSLEAQKLQSLNRALADAEQELVKAESKMQQASQSSADSEVMNNSTLQELKQRLAKLQSEYQAEQRSSRSFQSPVIQRLKQERADLQSQLSGNQSSLDPFNNPTIQSLKRQVAELQGQLSGSSSSVDALNSPTIQGMKRELSQLQSEYQDKLGTFKPDYPQMQQLQQRINSIRQNIARESATIQRSNQANLRQQINELNAQIARETSNISRNTTSNLQRKIAELDAQIARETQAINTNTQSNLIQQINSLRNEIARETDRISQTVSADIRAQYQAAKQNVDKLRAQVAAQEEKFVALREKNVGYNDLKRKVQSTRNIYQGLLDRQKEIGVAGGVESNNISIVDKASTPFNIYKPKLKMNLALGGVLGLFLGLVLAFLLEFMDDRVKSTEELERLLGLPMLGIIPRSKNKDEKRLAIMSQSDPRSSFAEAFRSLRTNLMFSTRQGMPKVLSITSAAPSEGKTTTSINLATVISQAGKTVLLVDTDLRNPSLHKRLGLDNTKGLTNYLTGQDRLETVTQSCQIPEVYVVTAGPLSPNPVELLSSEYLDHIMALAHNGTFDMVVMDMPPVLGLADALIISSRTDATMLSLAMGETKKQALVNAVKRLRQARANIIGTVLAKAKQGSGYGYHYDYNYYNYGQDKKMLDAA